jgi:hypothetical protein
VSIVSDEPSQVTNISGTIDWICSENTNEVTHNIIT